MTVQKTRKILVTGANGFVGQAVVAKLRSDGWAVRGAFRHAGMGEDCAVGAIDAATDWSVALDGITHVLHLAGHVHAPFGDDQTFHRVNVLGSTNLALAASRADVVRFVYVSSVKVHGEETFGRPWREDDPFQPFGAYARSKRDAEAALRQISDKTSMDIVIVRPPLVCGVGAGGNLAKLMGLVARGVPLPLASVRNRRSMVSVSGLAGLLALCLDHPAAPDQIFFAGEEPALSTPELLHLIAEGLERELRLFPCPPSLLRAGFALAGRSRAPGPLLNSLEIDAGKAKRLLGWSSSTGLEDSIIRMARSFAARRRE